MLLKVPLFFMGKIAVICGSCYLEFPIGILLPHCYALSIVIILRICLYSSSMVCTSFIFINL
jgi:hypothetical protein